MLWCCGSIVHIKKDLNLMVYGGAIDELLFMYKKTINPTKNNQPKKKKTIQDELLENQVFYLIVIIRLLP